MALCAQPFGWLTLVEVTKTLLLPSGESRKSGRKSPGAWAATGCLSEPGETRFSGIHQLHPHFHGTDAAPELHVPFAQTKGGDNLLAGAAGGLLDGEVDVGATTWWAVGVKDSIVVYEGEAIAPQGLGGNALWGSPYPGRRPGRRLPHRCRCRLRRRRPSRSSIPGRRLRTLRPPPCRRRCQSTCRTSQRSRRRWRGAWRPRSASRTSRRRAFRRRRPSRTASPGRRLRDAPTTTVSPEMPIDPAEAIKSRAVAGEELGVFVQRPEPAAGGLFEDVGRAGIQALVVVVDSSDHHRVAGDADRPAEKV